MVKVIVPMLSGEALVFSIVEKVLRKNPPVTVFFLITVFIGFIFTFPKKLNLFLSESIKSSFNLFLVISLSKSSKVLSPEVVS